MHKLDRESYLRAFGQAKSSSFYEGCIRIREGVKTTFCFRTLSYTLGEGGQESQTFGEVLDLQFILYFVSF